MNRVIWLAAVCVFFLQGCSRHNLFRDGLSDSTPPGSASSNVPQGNTVGNGGDFLEASFEQARVYAAGVVARVRRENFPRYLGAYLDDRDREWIFDRQTVETLSREINASRYHWNLDELSQGLRAQWKCPIDACACTPPAPAQDTYLSRSRCGGKRTRAEVASILTQTTLHRLPRVADNEDKAYRIAIAYFATWTNMGHSDSPHWESMSSENGTGMCYSPNRRQVVWTGDEMLVWDPGTDLFLSYSPSKDSWTRTETSNPYSWDFKNVPLCQQPHAKSDLVYLESYDSFHSVWAGKEWLLFSDCHKRSLGPGKSGISFDPKLNHWREITDRGAPLERIAPVILSAGRRIIVWGGSSCEPQKKELKDGGIYDPETRSWELIPAPPGEMRFEGRSGEYAAWVGGSLVLWGGQWSDPAKSHYDWRSENTGALYDLAEKRWRLLATHDLVPRGGVSAGSMGSNFLVIGENRQSAVYDLNTDTWASVGSEGGPKNLYYPGLRTNSIWTGLSLLFLGDRLYEYDPFANRWNIDLKTPRLRLTGSEVKFWTGMELLVWDTSSGEGNRFFP